MQTSLSRKKQLNIESAWKGGKGEGREREGARRGKDPGKNTARPRLLYDTTPEKAVSAPGVPTMSISSFGQLIFA